MHHSARDTTQVNIVQHGRAAYSLPRQAPTHTNLASLFLDLPCHSVHSELQDKSRQAFAHHARSGRVLVCGDARVPLYTLILCSNTARSPRGPPARSRMLEKGGGLSHQSSRQPCSSRPHRNGWGPPRTPTTVSLVQTRGHPANPSSKPQTGNCPPVGTPALRPLGNQPGTPREPTRPQRATVQHWGNPNQTPSWRPTGDTPRAN